MPEEPQMHWLQLARTEVERCKRNLERGGDRAFWRKRLYALAKSLHDAQVRVMDQIREITDEVEFDRMVDDLNEGRPIVTVIPACPAHPQSTVMLHAASAVGHISTWRWLCSTCGSMLGTL